jgi:hypothetical protein
MVLTPGFSARTPAEARAQEVVPGTVAMVAVPPLAETLICRVPVVAVA